MKLRMLDDSIRLRLSQSEANRIANGDGVHSHTRFPGGSMLGYAVEPTDTSHISAHLRDDMITVSVPAAAARIWATTNQVALVAEQPIDGGALRVLIEKDFECLDPRPGEEDRDAFPNPKAD